MLDIYHSKYFRCDPFGFSDNFRLTIENELSIFTPFFCLVELTSLLLILPLYESIESPHSFLDEIENLQGVTFLQETILSLVPLDLV